MKKTQVHLRLDSKLWLKARILALCSNKTSSAFVEAMMRGYFNELGGNRAIKEAVGEAEV